MMVSKHRIKPGDEDKKPEDQEYESYQELEVLNSMIPLWKKNKSELTDEDYNSFYKEKFYDFTDPLKVIHTNVEGVVSYTCAAVHPDHRLRTIIIQRTTKRVCSSILPAY